MKGGVKTWVVGLVVLAAGVEVGALWVSARAERVIVGAEAPGVGADRSRVTAARTLPLPSSEVPGEGKRAASSTPASRPVVRVAVIGGMVFTGFWGELAERYEGETGVRVEVVASGPKSGIVGVFKQGKVDVITMHSCDEMSNLAADGYVGELVPWMRNDMVIVGPAGDPAGVRGMTDAVGAMKKIAAARAAFVVPSSNGAREVLSGLMEPHDIHFDPARVTVMFDDEERSVLTVAAQHEAYTIVGRIPFRTGRMPNEGKLEVMVEGDRRLRRPYMVAVAKEERVGPGGHVEEGRRFARWLVSAETQGWIAGFGKGIIDGRAVFYPVRE